MISIYIYDFQVTSRLHIVKIQNDDAGRLPHAMDDAAGQLSTTASTAPQIPGAPSWGESQGCPKVWYLNCNSNIVITVHWNSKTM